MAIKIEQAIAERDRWLALKRTDPRRAESIIREVLQKFPIVITSDVMETQRIWYSLSHGIATPEDFGVFY